MSRGGRLLWLAIAIAVLALPACRGQDLEVSQVITLTLDEIFPSSLKATYVERLDDPEADDPHQWLVLYEYDLYEGDTRRFSPIAAVVYRADRGVSNHPPVIFPYPLRLPDRDYLGTGNVAVRSKDVLSFWPGSELVAVNQNSDGFITEAAIFRWNDPHHDEKWQDPDFERSYVCMGFFRADGGVKVEKDGVVVTKLQGDRSQLARFYKYEPDEGGSYFISGAQLRPTVDSWIDFAFGPMAIDTVLNSPYPEKIVLAFYNALDGPIDGLKPFLSKEAQEQLADGLPGYGCSWPLDQVEKVTVRQISYFPAVEAQTEGEEERQSLVELKIRCQSKLGGTASEDGNVGWFLRRQVGQWKMDHAYRPAE